MGKIQNIEKAKYEGYIWWSDKDRPEVFYGNEEVELSLNDDENPFIIEGNLWDKASKKSIFIRYVDGQYFTNETTVKEEDRNNKERCTEKSFIAHRIDGIRVLRFLQYWVTFEDPLCEKMETLRPEKLVFIGFDDNNKEE